jgi:hypothetical protein
MRRDTPLMRTKSAESREAMTGVGPEATSPSCHAAGSSMDKSDIAPHQTSGNGSANEEPGTVQQGRESEASFPTQGALFCFFYLLLPQGLQEKN